MWMIRSSSILDINDLTAEDLEILVASKKVIGSYDYLGFEGWDNFIIDRYTNKITCIGLTVPENFKNDSLNISEIRELNTFELIDILKINNKWVKPDISYLDPQNDELTCLSYDTPNSLCFFDVNSDLRIFLFNNQYYGFRLKNASLNIEGYNEEKIASNFFNELSSFLCCFNEELSKKLEDEDLEVYKFLKNKRAVFARMKDSRAEGVVDFIDNCFFAYY